MNEGKEALVHGLSNHLSSWNEFGIKLVKNILKIVSFYGFFRIKELQEFLNELGCNVNFQRTNFNSFIDDKLEEKLINTLKVRPCWINFIFLFNTSLRELQVRFLDIWKWPKDIFLDHGHDIIKMRNDQANHWFLVLKQLLNFINCIQSFSFAFHIFWLVFVVIGLLADQELLLETLLSVLAWSPASSTSASLLSASSCGSAGFAALCTCSLAIFTFGLLHMS